MAAHRLPLSACRTDYTCVQDAGNSVSEISVANCCALPCRAGPTLIGRTLPPIMQNEKITPAPSFLFVVALTHQDALDETQHNLKTPSLPIGACPPRAKHTQEP